MGTEVVIVWVKLNNIFDIKGLVQRNQQTGLLDHNIKVMFCIEEGLRGMPFLTLISLCYSRIWALTVHLTEHGSKVLKCFNRRK